MKKLTRRKRTKRPREQDRGRSVLKERSGKQKNAIAFEVLKQN